MLSTAARIADRAKWEFREWHTPSRPSFLQEELDHALLNHVPWRHGEDVLDVGCADGRYLAEFARRGARVTGIDISPSSLSAARLRGHTVAAASGDRLPFSDAAFDSIVCHKTLHLFPDPARLIGEFIRVMRPGGRIVFSSSNTRSPYSRCQALAIALTRSRNWAYANRLSARDWIAAFEARGLRTAAVYSCNLVWPLVFRVCDRWLIPNEWMRRYARWVRRVSGIPFKSPRPHALAQDFVVELVKPPA